MKIGLDGFALAGPRRDAMETLEFAKAYGLDGVFFGSLPALGPRLDTDGLSLLRARADTLGISLELGVGTVNPKHFPGGTVLLELGAGDYQRGLELQIRACRAIGCVELRTAMGDEADRFSDSVPWADQLQATQTFLTALAPLLRDLGCRLNLETHGDTTTFELVRMAERVGPDVVGICLDTANVLCRMEDPVAAVRRAAPYVHQTHAKDAIVYFVEDGLMRQTRPCGEGVVDWATVLPILYQYAPDLQLSIEDHKGLFGMRMFDAHWHTLHPDLTAREMSEVVRLARSCEQKITFGAIRAPDAYEAIPWPEQALQRLDTTVQHLRHTLEHMRSPLGLLEQAM